jgi:alpha-beta hydrolase superfamily lysophospholipase
MPEPGAIAHTEGRLETRDGLRLFWQRFEPAEPRGVLLLVHGLGEHQNRYGHVAAWFAERGFVVLAFDYRGHGRSDGPRVHVDRFDAFVEDLALFRAKATSDHPTLPLFLVGHSQGGLIVLRSALFEPAGLAGVVVSSPLLGVHPSARAGRALEVLVRILSVVAPSLRLPNHVDPTSVSRDTAVVAAYRKDPLVSSRVSSRWYVSLRAAIADTFERAGTLQVPLLAMASGSDRLVDPDATLRFAARAPSALVEFVRWDGLYHEMFNEPEQRSVFQRVHSWLSARLAAAAASR